MTNTKNQMTTYRASKLFTHLCVRDESLQGFKLVGGKMIIMTVKGHYDVKTLQAASEYDDAMYVKFKGIVYKYDSRDRDLPWSSVCHV